MNARDIREQANSNFPVDDECLHYWHTVYRCWWGRYGKCDSPDFGVPRCLSKELSLKLDRKEIPIFASKC